jgi:PKD repeat protein
MRMKSGILLLVLSLAVGLNAVADPAVPVRPLGKTEVSAKGLDESATQMIRLRYASYDPLRERPDYAAAGLPVGKDETYALVQFHDGRTDARRDLERLGVRFVGYVPDSAYHVRLDAGVRELVVQHRSVRWVGGVEPGSKIHHDLWPGSSTLHEEIVVVIFGDASLEQTAGALDEHPGVMRLETTDDGALPRIRYWVPMEQREGFLNRASRLSAVAWLQPHFENQLHNSRSSQVIQGGQANDAARTIFARELFGSGQIIAIADSGVDVDSCFFRGFNGREEITLAAHTVQPELGPLHPDNKIIGYWVQVGAEPYDDNGVCQPGGSPTNFHGTHVAGSALGDDVANLSSRTSAGLDSGDGMAPNAQLLFQDIGHNNGCLAVTDPYGTYRQAMLGGAGTRSDSWGADTKGEYTIGDHLLDLFSFENESMTMFTSAGNAGPGARTLSSPANAKNVISVGALSSSTTNTSIASFSARGPTADGRIKPDLVAPGQSIRSASGDATLGNNTCGTKLLSGTSMASPIAAGGSALVRQYLENGFYPTGSPAAVDSHRPLGTLVKAILLNGTDALPENGAFGETAYGWGRLRLDRNLHFPGVTRSLRLWNIPNEAGMFEGETHSYTVTVGAGEEFRVTLVWADPPASFGMAKALVNDLDLEVTNGSETYRGNVFSESGVSTSGGERDRLNNIEQVRFVAPDAGEWTVRVRAASVPGTGRFLTDRQGYALVSSQAACQTSVLTAPTRLSATSHPVLGIDLRLEPAPGSTVTQIYRAPAESPGDFQFIGTTTTGLFNDRRALGGETYVYRVRGADGCGEGAASDQVTIRSTSGCTLEPEFNGALSARSDFPNCRIVVEWSPAVLRCRLAEPLVYNIYRSTESDFVPSGEPYATVTGRTTFTDLKVTSGVEYFYIVRAEDTSIGGNGPHEGNEERNLRRVSSVPVGAPTSTETWTDDGGDTEAAMEMQFPWYVSERQAHEGQHSYHAGRPEGNHPNLTCAALTTPRLPLAEGAKLSYFARYNLENLWDGVVVEITDDDGLTWHDLPPDSGYPGRLSATLDPPVNQCGYPATQGAFTGPSGNLALTAWTEYTSDLAEYAGKVVRIRWRLTTDPGLEFEGFYLDTISITNVGVPGDCLEVSVVPEAAFSSSPRYPLAPGPVRFRDESLNAPTSWSWSFGDGGSSTLQNPEHHYQNPGRYLVTLTVANAAGSDSVSREIVVFDGSFVYEPAVITPGQARAQGAQNSFFKSSFWMTNVSSTETTIRLRYLPTPANADGGALATALYSIRPNESVSFSNVLTEALGADSNTAGVIVVEVRPGRPVPIVTSRTYNEPGLFSGTSGQYIPGVRLGSGQGNIARIDGLSGNDAFRSNVGVVNLEAREISATITILDSSGGVVGTPIPLRLAAHSATQVNAANRIAGLGDVDLFSAVVDATGAIFVYASKLDNVTSDPSYVPSTLVPRAQQWIDGVGAVPGAGGTFFRSNLSITNRNASPAEVAIDYVPRGSGVPAATQSITIGAESTRFFQDAVTELFPAVGGAGTFIVRTSAATPVVAWARTFNDRDLSGTLGQFIPAFGTEDLIGAQGAILQGLSESGGFRTNLGIVNVSTGAAALTAEVWSRDGVKIGEKTYHVGAGQAAFIGRVMLDVTGRQDISDAYLRLKASASNALYAWASYVDNRSTDQTFVRPLPIE